MDYIKDNIDSSGYLSQPTTTLKEDLEVLSSEFQRVALFPNNFRVMKGNYQRMFTDYLQGLPSHVQTPYYYSEMREVLTKILRVKDLDNFEDGAISDFFYSQFYYAVNNLLAVHGMEQLFELKIK